MIKENNFISSCVLDLTLKNKAYFKEIGFSSLETGSTEEIRILKLRTLSAATKENINMMRYVLDTIENLSEKTLLICTDIEGDFNVASFLKSLPFVRLDKKVLKTPFVYLNETGITVTGNTRGDTLSKEDIFNNFFLLLDDDKRTLEYLQNKNILNPTIQRYTDNIKALFGGGNYSISYDEFMVDGFEPWTVGHIELYLDYLCALGNIARLSIPTLSDFVISELCDL